MPTLEEKIDALRKGKYTHAFGHEEEFATNKVPEDQVEAIKKTYSLNPEVQAEAAVNQDQGIDTEAIRKKAETLNPSPSKTDLALGLIPLAISAIAGGYGEGAQVAAPYYMGLAQDSKKRQQTLEDKLLELEKKKIEKKAAGEKGSKRFQAQNLVDNETKQVIKATFDTFTGKYFDASGQPLSAAKLRAGFSVIPEEYDRRLGVKTDVDKSVGEYFGRGARISPESGNIVVPKEGRYVEPEQPKGFLNPKQEKELTDISSKFMQSPVYKENVNVLNSASKLDELISAANSGNAVASEQARTTLAKMAEGAARLSDQDIERLGGSRAYKEQASRFANLQTSSLPMTTKDIAEFKEVARIYALKAKENIEKGIAGAEEDYVKNYGGKKGAMGIKMKALVPEVPKSYELTFPMKVRKKGFEATVKNAKELREAQAEGWN